MPITLNHSNIGVQYSTGSNYIIETVKSDLYRKNEIYDSIVRDNIQVAPVTPIVSIQDGSNVYAVESYTYSETANTADYTRVFTKNTTCDILIIGGGGGGGFAHGGGGGAGQLVLIHQATLNGKYTIKVGKGGTGGLSAGTEPTKGINSEFGTVIAEGGGANGGTLKDGGSGAGGDGYTPSGGTAGAGNKNTTIDTFPGATVYSRGNNGGNNGGAGATGPAGGGGGGAGQTGTTGQDISPFGKGGDGLSGISEINYDFKTKLGNYGNLESDGNYWFAAGGGGGGSFAGNGGKGGGGAGAPNNNTSGFNAINNTGSGGGGGGGNGNEVRGGNGGSGIVIIRYLLGTIPANNLLTNEPSISPNNIIYSNTFFPRTPSPNSFTWIDSGYTVTVKDTSDTWYSNFPHNLFNYSSGIFHSSQVFTGSGWTYVGSSRFKTLTGLPLSIDLGRAIYPTRMRITPNPFDTVYGTKQDFINAAPKAFKIFASNDVSCWNDNNHASWTLIHDQTTAPPYTLESQATNNTVPTIVNFQSNLPKYRYYTMVVLSLVGNYAGGYMMLTEWLIGGDEKIDAIPDGILNKRLDFVVLDITKNVEYQAQQKTGVGGWRIVRFLPPTSTTWYPINDNLVGSTYVGSSYNYTNYWTIPFGTFDEFVFATLNMKYWLHCTKTTAYASYNGTSANIIKSSFSSTPYTASWYNRGAGNPEDPLILIHNSTSDLVYGENSSLGGKGYISIDGGMCVLVRDSTASTTIPNPNLYTLNFPVPTLADINNNSNIVLRGAYDLALSTSNALIIPKEGQYIPKPTTFTNYAVERMYPPVRNFTAATTTISGQTYGNGTYVVSYSSYHETFQPFKCFNTSDTIGGHWVDNYTNGNYNGSANIVSGYLGDWLKIQLPVAIKLTRFSFVQRTDIPSRSPKDFKIYGSNDNITWVELINKTDAIYNASYIYEKTTPEITNTYTYYGLVVNKLLAGQYNTVLNFDEWYIYGQEPSNSLSIRYNILNPILDPIGAQWTYNTSNTNVYHMGRVGIGTTSPEYQIDVSGTLNAKAYYFNGVQIGRLSEGMVANVQHLTYTHMEIKNNTGWDAINDDLTTGFVISITPKSNLSKILVNLIAHIGLTTSNDARWWGIKLYRKIGTAAWAEVTGSNGTETGSAATTAGTPVWISHNMGTTTASYAYQIINLTGTYLDSPNTTSTVYYTAYWNQRMGDNPSRTGELWLNRAANQDDAYRPAPSSSWTLKEIWYG